MSRYESKDNEFIAWYPNNLTDEVTSDVWARRRAAYYVHIPFCSAICDYCGFAIEKLRDAAPHRYFDLLQREIDRYAETSRLASYEFTCGHFGGGTPSAVDASFIVNIKRLIDHSFAVSKNAEITVEVNPISFDSTKAEAYAEAGVNRISFGLQSFDEDTLSTIGRPHGRNDVESTLEVIRAVGWDNFSCDLIYGVPSQTLSSLESDLRKVVDTGATHVSCFRLEIIPFTALKLKEGAGLLPPRCSRELLDEMDDLVASQLTAAGYRHYGTFNFAKPGYESVHNEIAFVAPQGEYIGFGNSAYSYINDCVYCNYADLTQYQSAVAEGRDPIAYAIRVTAREAMSRYFVLGLKFHKVSRSAFASMFGLPAEEVFGSLLDELQADGLLVKLEDAYELTPLGIKHTNNVCKEFYTADNVGIRQHLQFTPQISPRQVEYFMRKAKERGTVQE